MLDTLECVLLREREAVALSPKAFEILRILVQNGPHLVTKKDLMAAIWPDRCVEEANLTVNISLLRKVLGQGADGRRLIETVPKRGYRFAAEVREFADEQAALGGGPAALADLGASGGPVSAAPLETSQAARRSKSGVLFLLSAALMAVVFLILIAGMKTRYQPAKEPVRSIAVLPFRSLSSKPSDESLGLGITDALITHLGALRQFVVTPAGAVRKFRWLDQDSVAFGQQLRVDAVLEGSIQTLGPRIRTTVRLLRVPDGAALWAEKFEHDLTDMFAVEDLISYEVATIVALKLTAAEARSAVRFGRNFGSVPEGAPVRTGDHPVAQGNRHGSCIDSSAPRVLDVQRAIEELQTAFRQSGDPAKEVLRGRVSAASGHKADAMLAR